MKNNKYLSRYNNKYGPKLNHYIPNDYPPYFENGSIFKVERYYKVYFFTIIKRNKIKKYKTFIYKVDLETYILPIITIDSLGAAWNVKDPKYIQNMKKLGTLSHSALINLKDKKINNNDYVKFFLTTNLIKEKI